MTRTEALKNHLSFTGMAWDRCDLVKRRAYMEKAAEFRKKYRIKLVIVKEANGWESYYSDSYFQIVQYDSVDSLQKRLDEIPNTLKQLEEEYEKKIREIMNNKAYLEDKIAQIKAITK